MAAKRQHRRPRRPSTRRDPDPELEPHAEIAQARSQRSSTWSLTAASANRAQIEEVFANYNDLANALLEGAGVGHPAESHGGMVLFQIYPEDTPKQGAARSILCDLIPRARRAQLEVEPRRIALVGGGDLSVQLRADAGAVEDSYHEAEAGGEDHEVAE